jgi:serine/threonine-protein kinase
VADQQGRIVGRYALYNAIAAGGMATVHLGRLIGSVGFSRTVAIKRLHAQFASDPEFVSMFLDEARLAARIRHPNVVPTLDVVSTDGELFLVMDYVPGESVSRLSRALRERSEVIPLRIMSATMAGVLHGLHAAHEAKDERGQPLGIVHRDVSPQNVILGTDGVPRVLDFGVAKAAGRIQTTKEGQIKGKLSYMPPEQLRGSGVSRQTDIYAVGVMLWELVTGERLFSGDNEGVIVGKVLEGVVEPPSEFVARSGFLGHTKEELRFISALDSTILRALSKDPEQRFSTAREMALEIERRCPPTTASECGDWLESIAHEVLASRAAMVADIENSASMTVDAARDGHVMSVLNAGATPSPRMLEQAPPHMQSGPVPLPHPHSSTVLAAVNQPYAAVNQPYVVYPYSEGPPVTQPSSISVTSGSVAPPPSELPGNYRAAGLTAAVGVLLGVSLIGAALWYRHTQAVARTTDLDPIPTLTAEPVPVQPTPIASPTVAVANPEMDLDAGFRSALGTAVAPVPLAAPPAPPPVVKFNPGPRRPSGGAKAPASAQSPGDDCVYYDSAGVKKYKQHCLNK